MKIRLDEDFYLDKDDYCFALRESKHKVDKQGNELYSGYGYFGTIEAALNRYKLVKIERRHEIDEITIAEYIKELKTEGARIGEIMRGIE